MAQHKPGYHSAQKPTIAFPIEQSSSRRRSVGKFSMGLWCYEIAHDLSGKVGMYSARGEFKEVNQGPIVRARNGDWLLAQFLDRQFDNRLNQHGSDRA